MKFAQLALVAMVATVQAEDKCCEVCGTDDPNNIKTYSLDKIFNHCGESCIPENLFWLYKIFEFGLKKADTNDAHPCAEIGYSIYTGTDTHGFKPIFSATLDFYDQPLSSEAIPVPDWYDYNQYLDMANKYVEFAKIQGEQIVEVFTHDVPDMIKGYFNPTKSALKKKDL